MKYISTRGLAPEVSSTEALLNGIAPDGGLYVPVEIPSNDALPNWLEADCDYAGTMRKLLALFFDDIPEHVRNAAVERSVARFANPKEPVSLRWAGKEERIVEAEENDFFDESEEEEKTEIVDSNLYFLDLTQGPTGAFKDVALTILPTLLQYAAEQAGLKKAAILTATSGDTGSAAMRGFAGVAGTEVLVFFPKTGTSEIQRRQMVCCEGGNVHACAIEGNFDDAQAGVKAVFADEKIRADAAAKGIFLSSANSINIGRLFPQVCYYLMAWRQLHFSCVLGEDGFDVVVPTGNFGNILAAFYAKKLGAPIRRFIVASNENNVVAEFIQRGIYNVKCHVLKKRSPRTFKVTNSPSMDILVSSNIERFIFEISGRNSEFVRESMAALKEKGEFVLDAIAEAGLKEAGFDSGFAGQGKTLYGIQEAWRRFKNLLDPHTAIGLKVAVTNAEDAAPCVPVVIAETATPWKFPKTVIEGLRQGSFNPRGLKKPSETSDFENLKNLADYLARELSPEERENFSPRFAELEAAPVLHDLVCAKDRVGETVRQVFGV